MKDIFLKIVIPVILFLFVIFLGLKINGYFDFSHKYNIAYFEADFNPDFTNFMLDDEEETVWGDMSFWQSNKRDTGSYLRIVFDSPQDIKSLSMHGKCPDYLKFMYVDKDGNKILVENVKREVDDDVFEYTFDTDVNTEELYIEVEKQGENNRWIVGELKLNEEDDS